MSNIGTVEQIYQAFLRADFPAILEKLTPDVIWEYGIHSTDVPWLQPRSGKSGVAEFFNSLAAIQLTSFKPHRLLESGGIVVALINLEGSVKATQRKIIEEDEIHIWHFNAQGLVTKFRHRADTYQHWAAYKGR